MRVDRPPKGYQTIYVGEDGIESGVPYLCHWADGAPVVERVDEEVVA